MSSDSSWSCGTRLKAVDREVRKDRSASRSECQGTVCGSGREIGGKRRLRWAATYNWHGWGRKMNGGK